MKNLACGVKNLACDVKNRAATPGAALPGRTRGLLVVLSCLATAVVCLAQVLGLGAQPALAQQPATVPPLPGPVLRGFQVGEQNWLPGHRGVDLAGNAGQLVVAAAPGTISWVGTIAGVPMMTVEHPGGLRTTYQPVEAILPPGSLVSAGQAIAILGDGHCALQACLHWGLRDGETYLDPIAWLAGGGAGNVRLLPRSATPRPFPPVVDVVGLVSMLAGGLPVAGPITSGYGGRINPISGATEFHDGIDIGAPCGAGVQTLWPGVVSLAGGAGGYGLRVEVDHGVVAGVRLVSSYSHLSAFAVATGQNVGAGTVVGLVGSTGYSTGCHLHYSATADGRLVDPRTLPS